MQAKKELAGRIVSDFHSEAAAVSAAEDWAKQFQKDEVPEEIEHLRIAFAEVASRTNDASSDKTKSVRLDRLLFLSGLADSVSDASRKLKQKAVRIGSQVVDTNSLSMSIPGELTLRVGRKIKSVTIQ